MHLFPIIKNLRIQDVLDIVFLTVMVYHLYLWFWGTKAFKALVGLIALGVVFTFAQSWGLFLTTWVFQILWQVLVVLLLILFQSEIRQALERFNPLKVIRGRRSSLAKNWIPDFVIPLVSMSKQNIGALIIFERRDLVDEWITGGTELEGEVSPGILMSIFHKASPLHDGAVVIRNDRIVKAACYLPLSSADGLPKEWGTRHRAALGLSERCDACILVISEERGEISVARDGQMTLLKNTEELSKVILEAVTPQKAKGESWIERAHSMLFDRWAFKLGSLGLVVVIWLLLAGQQDFEVGFKVPLEVKNLPPNMEILAPLDPRVQITVRGLRKDASTLGTRNVRAELDLSMARLGKRVFRITRNEIVMPTETVDLVHIDPSQIEFKFKEAMGTK